MHHPAFQRVESLWHGVEHLITRTDFRINIKVE
ncbi:type VI secretion system contractile sheath large subunit [Serratia fonticola]|nr:type VI secretion system contractile sheath large subunit [Serratia fonticola]